MKMHSSTAQLLVIDAQVKLFAAMSEQEDFERNCPILLSAAREMDVPVTLSQQYPSGLGPTIDAVDEAAGSAHRFDKMSFSWFDDSDEVARLAAAGRKDLVMVGMEAHVCVLQTALDAKEAGYNVFVVADTVLSRATGNKRLGLDRMAASGIEVVSTEMVAFEWLGTAEAPTFRTISKMLR